MKNFFFQENVYNMRIFQIIINENKSTIRCKKLCAGG